MFLTAASSNHFKTVKQFIKSLNGEPVIFYDIGLTQNEINEIKLLPIEYRLFDWSLVPPWGLLSSTYAGSYVWKPIIVHTVFQENYDILIWCDAGNIIYNIKELVEHIKDVKLYTPVVNATLYNFSHQVCLDKMNMTEEERHYTMRNAAIIGLVNEPIVKQFIDDWKSYSLIEEIIVGCRSNHRHDQSILSCLFYKYNRKCLDNYIGFTIHNDCD
jgi:hypothetical protein